MVGSAGATRVMFSDAMSEPSISPAKTAMTPRSTPPVVAVFAALGVAGTHEAIREQARRRHAESEHLGQAADGDLTLVPQDMHGSHLLHRYVQVAPLAGGRVQERAMKSPVADEGVVD